MHSQRRRRRPSGRLRRNPRQNQHGRREDDKPRELYSARAEAVGKHPGRRPRQREPQRGGRDVQSRRPRRYVQDALQEERHHREHGVAGEESEEARQRPQREHALAEQREVEHRLRRSPLPEGESDKQPHAKRRRADDDGRKPAETVGVGHHEQKGGQPAGGHERAEPIEPAGDAPDSAAAVARARRAALQNDYGGYQRNRAQRDARREHAAPTEGVHQKAGHDGPHNRAKPDHRHEHADDAPALGGREGRCENRHAVRLNHRRARALRDSEGDYGDEVRRERRRRRAENEHREPGAINRFAPHHVRNPPGGQKQRPRRQHIPQRHPLHEWNRRAEFGSHQRQRERDPRLVENGHESPRRDGQQDETSSPSSVGQMGLMR